MTDRILRYPDPRLRQKAQPVLEITPKIRERALGLVKIMNEHNGIGLAAAQVGWPVRIIAIKWSSGPVTDWSQCEDKILVNPVILEAEGPLTTQMEACLSLPGIEAQVVRPLGVGVKGTDLDGNTFYHCSEGIVARCMQHELDHLDGILFFDRVTPLPVEVQDKLKRLSGEA